VTMRLDRILLLSAALGAAALTACDAARPTAGSPPTATCLLCHGGTDNDTGAPPRAVNGSVAVSDVGVGSHSAHVDAGVACGTCHTVPDAVAFPGHRNGTAEVVFNQFARKNVPAGQLGSMWNATAGTCAVYCHGTGLNLGGANITPVWTAPPAGGLGCASCHGAPPSIAPHTGTMALTDCAGCHSTSIANVNGVPTFVAGGTHLDGNPNSSITGCTGCHGDASRSESVSLNQAAPPKDLLRRDASDKVGAHQAHLHAGLLASAFTCDTCHVVPGDQAHATANLGDAKVRFTGLGAKNPGAGFAGGTCSGVYCHGATLSGGTKKTTGVLWAGGTAEAACGTCHGFPPPAPHTQTPTTAAQCNACHPGTVNADGSINRAGHVNGSVEANGAAPHAVPFPSAQHGPAAKADVGSCKACHGADLNGGIGPSCTACHTANGHPTWQTECTFCHGSTRTADSRFTVVGTPAITANLAGPPLAATTRPLGAHEAHFSNDPSTGNKQSLPILCEQCHGTLPPDYASHMNGSVAIGWGTLATGNNTVTPTPAPVAGQLPAAQEANPNCTNYCHGAGLVGGSRKATGVLWTGGAAEAACGTCHAVPQPYSAAGSWHVQNPDCGKCHPGSTITAPAVATHVDGSLTLSALTCTSCHGTAAAGNEAPPIATDGSTTGVKVGAHQAHLTGTRYRSAALGCADCHGARPTSTGHASGTIDVGWSSLAGAATPAAFNATWEATPTCTNSCHGATNPTTVDSPSHTATWTAAISGCTACHGSPGAGEHRNGTALHTNLACSSCHFSVLNTASNTTITDKSLHINGVRDVQINPALLGAGGSVTKSGSSYTCAVLCHPGGQTSSSW